MTDGLSWNAPSEQCLPKTARALKLRMLLAACSRSKATSDDLGVVWSSSLVRSQRGLAAMCLVSWE